LHDPAGKRIDQFLIELIDPRRLSCYAAHSALQLHFDQRPTSAASIKNP
jgi:hypothetical protein